MSRTPAASSRPSDLTIGYLPQDGLEHSRPHGVRGGEQRLSAAARHQGGDARHRAPARRRVRCPRTSTSRCSTAMPSCRTASGIGEGYSMDLRIATVLRGLGFRTGRRPAAVRDVLGRLADAHRAGQAAARPAQPAAARRADQPPRSRRAQLARGISRRLPLRRDPRLARSLLPRRGRHPHHRSQPAEAHRLRRQLRSYVEQRDAMLERLRR